ncbi:hypothetical protein ACI76Y_06900 [Capnocytophaga cynodegmi]|uniref:hypothetical protein n=1 Tax=Capnocytophaga cynodegmi TaxID=28189 RepID=UPI00385A7F3F
MKNTLKMMAVAFLMFAFNANAQTIGFNQEVQIVQEKDGIKQEKEKKSCCKNKEGKKECSKDEKSCSKEGKKSCCKKNKKDKK